MTIEEFLKELSNYPAQFYVRDGQIRDENCMCPIASLVKNKLGIITQNHKAAISGCVHLKMNGHDCQDIIYAADGYHIYIPRIQDLRSKLREACRIYKGFVFCNIA